MAVVDLLGPSGRGPVWGTATEDLNATLLAWTAGEGPPEHVNGERDVLIVILDGSATFVVDGDELEASAGELVVIPKGARRAAVAGPEGARYLTVHTRRGGLEISRPAPSDTG